MGGNLITVGSELVAVGMVIKQNHQNKLIKIAVVGDVHEQWEPADAAALKHLGVDLVLFVGDLGNESVPVVQQIAGLDIPKAVVLGNHDAWYTATDWGRSKCPYDRHKEDWVQQQLDLLGDTHVGYGKLDFPQLGLTVVGGRPFSWGGSVWKYPDFYQRFGATGFASSAQKIVDAARQASQEIVLFIGHNGPTGLGALPEDPCGKDWKPIGGDYGDPDLAEAIAQTQAMGKQVSLVAFGHMHHHLRHTQQRRRRCIHLGEGGTVYLNAASVPRIIKTDTGTLRNFSLVYLEGGMVSEISLVWVGADFAIASEQVLYTHTADVQLA